MSDEYISFPEAYNRRKLNALYREIPLKDTTSRTLRKYFNAMAHLYGIIPLQKAWEIIHSQCPRMISEAEFWAFAEIAQNECEDFFILGEDALYNDVKSSRLFQREIIDGTLFLLGEDLYYLTKDNQQEKPYYIPEKQELLRYSDQFYYEETPYVQELTKFCKSELKMPPDTISRMLDILEDNISYFNPDPHGWLSILNMPEVQLDSQQQTDRFMQLCQDVYNNGRMQCNRGHTPREVYDMYPPENRIPKAINLGPNIRNAIANGTIDANEMRSQIFSMELPNEELRLDMLRQIAEIEAASQPKKVSRNAPCPCGSGRKYKNCCGKKSV